jgi:hypothetical protein
MDEGARELASGFFTGRDGADVQLIIAIGPAKEGTGPHQADASPARRGGAVRLRTKGGAMVALAGVKNPIRWQEITHQERNAPRWMRFGATLGPIFLLALLVYTPLTLPRIDSGTREIGLVTIWILHAAVAVRCIVAGRTPSAGNTSA